VQALRAWRQQRRQQRLHEVQQRCLLCLLCLPQPLLVCQQRLQPQELAAQLLHAVGQQLDVAGLERGPLMVSAVSGRMCLPLAALLLLLLLLLLQMPHKAFTMQCMLLLLLLRRRLLPLLRSCCGWGRGMLSADLRAQRPHEVSTGPCCLLPHHILLPLLLHSLQMLCLLCLLRQLNFQQSRRCLALQLIQRC
jgi:hypothetical protein